MTEAKWLEFRSPTTMLDFLGSKVSGRKIRLFACASCRRVWHLLEGVARAGIETSEKFADDRVSKAEMKAVWRLIHTPEIIGSTDARPAYAARAASNASQVGHRQTREAWLWSRTAQLPNGDADVTEDEARETSEQVSLLRHIIGNPFRPYPVPAHWPAAVVQLAESLYNGTDCGFALHDALLEAGHTELAEHFAKEQWHPKGCWVVDLILGKK